MSSVVQRINRFPLALWCALMFGVVAGILTVAAPHWQLERAVTALGIDQIVPAAEPPLGRKARILFAALAAGLVAAAILIPYAILRLARPRKKAHFFHNKPIIVPSQSRGSEKGAARQTPARRPIFADQELGAPLMSEAALAHASSDVRDPTRMTVTAESYEPMIAETARLQEPSSEIGSIARPAFVDPSPAANISATTSLSEMITRLEEGLAGRQPHPPQPPKPSRTPPPPMLDGDEAARPASSHDRVPTERGATVPPLAIVPRSEAPHDTASRPGMRTDHDALLAQAMRKLSVLVGGRR